MSDASEHPVNAGLLAAIRAAFECPRVRGLSDKGVHAVRKKVKKGRAALRLLRPVVAEADYRRANAMLRDRGRRLAPLRDAKSLLETLDKITLRHASELRGVELAPLRQSLLARCVQARRELSNDQPEDRACAESLERFNELAARSGLAHVDSVAICDGLRRIYRKGRRTSARARRMRTSEALHTWRKQVKYLLNATAILQSAGVRRLRKIIKRADRIAGLLGDDHDLAMLLDAFRGSAVDPHAAEILHDLVSRRRRKLQARAFDHRGKLFEKKPGRFVSRIDVEKAGPS